MFDPQDDDLTRLLIDAIENAIGAAACGPDPDQIPSQRLAGAMGADDQSRGQELDHGGSHRVGDPGTDRPLGARCQNEVVAAGLRHERRRRTASTPRRTSPRAYAASASWMSAKASGLLSTSTVSSSWARSSGLIRT